MTTLTSHVPIDCVSVRSCQCGEDEACKYVQEIEALRAYIAEIEKWKDDGERMIGPAAEWGPGGNVMVRSSVMFKLGAW